MLHINSVQLLGVVGDTDDIKIHRFKSGERVAEFTLVTDKHFLDAKTGEQKIVAQCHNVMVWPHYFVDVVEHRLGQGVPVMVMGELYYEDDEDAGGAFPPQASVVLQGAGAQLLILDGEVAGEGKE